MKNDLDLDLIASLEEEEPKPSGLSAERLHGHEDMVPHFVESLSVLERSVRVPTLRAYRVLSVLAAVGLILILLWGVLDLPLFGRETNPADNEVAARYLEAGLREGGATNLVANMILDYRAFDTLGESNVLFTASCAVLLLLRWSRKEERTLSDSVPDAPADPILQATAKLLLPFLLVYGIYLILTGHLGPGGGFSGGTLLGAAMILFRSAFGPARAGAFFSYRTCRNITFAALTFYALSKAYSFYTGANGLPSFISVGTPGTILSAGLILPLNIAVGLVVSCTMYGFFALFEKGDW